LFDTQSLTKISLMAEQLREIAAECFGKQRRLAEFEELKEGFFNTAYRLELDDGTQAVLKVSPPRGLKVLHYEAGLMEAEVEAMRLVRERTEMPVPEVLCYDPSRRLAPGAFYIMPYLPGAPLHKVRSSLPEAVQYKIDHELGRLLRQVNAIRGAAFGYFSDLQPRFDRWSQAFAHMLEGVLLDGEAMDIALPVPYEALRKLLLRSQLVLDEVTAPSLVHWDLWDGNIFVDPDSGQITGIIDFERALWGDPLMETNFGYNSAESAFMQGYGKPMLTQSSERQRQGLYALYLFAIMIIETYYRQYPTPDQKNWAWQRMLETWEKVQAA
jgi:aminoglycoside phosphotransferase (APT) family kinase protein